MSLSGKVAIITGASSGIGRATAVLFARLGASLSLSGRNEENLKTTLTECEKSKNEQDHLAVTADMTKESEVENLLKKTIQHFGKLDILINNAGILELGSIETTSLEQYDRVMNINVRSMYQLTMLAVPYLVEAKGTIVNVSSVNGVRSFPNVLAYNISKAAVDAFTRCVALELAPKHVRVNSVNPGVIITELQKRGGLNEEDYQAFLEKSKTTHALGRPGYPEEVALAIAFLAGPDSSFTTGVQLPVDGGRHAMCPR